MGIIDKIKNIVSSAHPEGAISKLAIDGKGGVKTIKQLQRFLGTKQDGWLAGQMTSLKKYRPNITAVNSGSSGSDTVKHLQKWLSIKQDGQWGQQTSKALQKKLGVKQDGVFGSVSVKALQKYLNTHEKAVYPSPTPTPTPTPSGNKQKLINEAVRLAWAKGTASSKYKYPSGSATSAFKTALNKVYPEHTKWGKAPSVGASCDVFVGTVVRSAGIDSKFPRGLEEQEAYTSKAFDRYVYTNVKPIDKSQNGDIVMFNYSGGAHTVIRGNGFYYEANYQTYFGHTNTSLDRLKKSYKKVIILRPKG